MAVDNLEQYYKVLGLELGASLEEVNQAYKDLAFIWHPDRLPKENPRLIEKSVEKIKEINHARDLLRSAHRRNGNSSSQAKPSSAAKQTSKSQNRYYNPYSYRQGERGSYSNGNRSYSDRGAYDPRNYYRQGERTSYGNGNGSYSNRSTYEPKHYYHQSDRTSRTSRNSYRANDCPDYNHKNYYRSTYGNSYKRPYDKDMKGVDLSRANLKEKDLSGKNLQQANLSYADLSDSFLHNIILEEANLTGANLFRANLLAANLKKANLRDANLIGADLSGADLSGADLTGAKVGTGNKILVKLTGVKLTGTILPDGSIHT